MRHCVAAVFVVVVAGLTLGAPVHGQGRGRGQAQAQPGFVSEGVPRMPNPPGPAPKRDLSGAWVGPRGTNKPDPVPPMTPAGQAEFKLHKPYGAATNQRDGATEPPSSNDPFITCDPLGFPRDLLAQSITGRGGTLFATMPDRIIIAYEQQRVWREVWMDGRALPTAVDVKGAPESRYYGYSVGHWENDNTLVIDTTGVDERPWLDDAGHPRSSSAHIQERYTRVDQYNLQVTVTVDDPKFYTKPWTFMKADFYWMKAQEFAETLCIPSEALDYRDTISKPSGINIVK